MCTSDVHTVHGALPVPEGRTLGHEAVGTVHALGDAVEGFAVGDRVLVGAATPCWRCGPCQRGNSSQCRGLLGGYKFTAQMDGNMSDYFFVNEATANLVPIPDQVPDEQAVYVADMLPTGNLAIDRAEVGIGDRVAIFAQGAVGLSATISARLHGAAQIIAVETVPERAALARQFGADEVVDFREVDPVQRIMELSDGEGVDAAVEALGSKGTFTAAVQVTRPGGRVSNVGYHSEGPLELPLEAFGLGMGDMTIRGSLCTGGSEHLGRLLRLIASGRIDPSPMTTHELPFDRVEEAFRLMESKEDGVLKPLIRF